jgi:anthranilate phosphoribosyltransferase
MSLTQALKRLGGDAQCAGALDEREALVLFSAMLDGGMGELELGAALAFLERRPVAAAELLGAGAALAQRCYRLKAPAGAARPVVFSSYHGLRDSPHLLPLVALALQRLGVPVLVHGTLDGAGGVAAAYILRELGVLPCASPVVAQSRLEERRVAFVPVAALAPGLADLLALRARLGFGTFVQVLANLLPPFASEALHVVGVSAAAGSTLLRECLAARGLTALLLEGVEGEPFADPRRRPRIEHVTVDGCKILFEAETGTARHPAVLPAAHDAHTVAAWIRRALAGETPVPLPLVNQIACCLYGAGYTDDMNQAKAIVAVEIGSLAAA